MADLIPLVYDELHRIAERMMRGEREEHTLQPTALIHEAWVRLGDDQRGDFDGHGHFVRVAAQAMRNVLVDHARARSAEKRGGQRKRLDLEADGLDLTTQSEHLLEVHDALGKLAETDEQLARLVELRLFAGLSNAEIAQAMGMSLRTVERDWRLARAWLVQKLG